MMQIQNGISTPGRYLMNAILHDHGMTSVAEAEYRQIFEKDENGLEMIEGDEADRVEVFACMFFQEHPDLLTEEDLDEIATGDVSEVQEKYGDRKFFADLQQAIDNWYENF